MNSTATEVEARFGEDGRVTVRSFTWRGQRQRVTSQGRQWTAADGRHVLVMLSGERVFELLFTPASGTWQVAAAPKAKSSA